MTQRHILLIDDDELLSDTLAIFLEASGYVVTKAENGRVGLDRLGEGQFDLVILDLLMPEMDGIRFLHHLRPGEGPPVLVLSASATADVVDAADFPSVAGIVRKPVQPAQLIARIAAILAGPGSG